MFSWIKELNSGPQGYLSKHIARDSLHKFVPSLGHNFDTGIVFYGKFLKQILLD